MTDRTRKATQVVIQDDEGSPRDSESDASENRTRRLYLSQRKNELLAQIDAITEHTAALLDEPAIADCDRFREDLATIREYSVRLGSMVLEAVCPDRQAAPQNEGLPGQEDVAKALNHDMRSLLTVVLGYAEDLIRLAPRSRLDDFLPELALVQKLGQRTLCLIDEMVSELRGLIQAGPESTVGERTKAASQLAGVVEELDASTLRPSVDPGRILVVEDNPSIREILIRHLEGQGHTVEAASDGVEALERVVTCDPDLILLDIVMPRINGFQVLAQLKANPQFRETPVVMISGLDDMDGIARCIGLGAEDVLPKPFHRVMLKARVDACLEKKRLRDRTEHQRRRFDELLHEILPASIVAELTESRSVPPRRHDDVAVLFADIKGFTSYCDGLASRPEVVVGHLQQLFESWDEIAARRDVQKIKTIGDAFMGASGLLQADNDPVWSCLLCGLEMIAATQAMPTGWDLRVGVHVGPVVAGVLGRRQYLYDLWGDTVNTASRLESNGHAGCINLSGAAWGRIAMRWPHEPPKRSFFEAKGKGKLEVYHLHANTRENRLDAAPRLVTDRQIEHAGIL